MTEETAQNAPNDVEAKIIRQLEYYFGDMNLPKDKFLQEESKKDDGWIPISVLTTFNRLKVLSTDPKIITDALKKSTKEIVEISEDNLKLRRDKSKPLPENRLEFWQKLKVRTVYAKGFPEDSKLDDLMEFFSKYGKVENLVMRRIKNEKRPFKGSVFVTFESQEACEKFVKAEGLKYGDTELIKYFETDYHKKKIAERSENKKKKQEEKLAAQKHVDQKQQKENGEKEGKNESTFKKGLVIKLTDLPENDVTLRTFREFFEKHGEVSWVDFNRGDKEAFVRVNGEENAATTILDKIKSESDGKIVINDKECTVDILTGEAENDYWQKTNENRRNARNKKRGGGDFKKGGRKQNNFKGRGRRDRERNGDTRNKKRPAEESNSEPPASKVAKTDTE